jgi:DNA-binding CsgD family transcriptional regulator
MFPDFINQFNMLFKPEDRISLKNDESMPAELRIFALIRLGINESEKIANFLDYSVHTVNNYKTKVKNRSIIPNELFEQAIMKIESFKTDSGEK